MISRISGKVRKKADISILIDISGITYEVFIPPAIMKSFKGGIEEGSLIELVTYHYYQIDPSRSIPMLIGFINEIEREFFEQFITVSGIGPKAACRALILPFSTIADAIDKGDITILKTLPGVGEQRARQIIAKLQNKIGKFGLIQDKGEHPASFERSDIKGEAIAVLLQLQYKPKEAEDMVNKAITFKPNLKSCEELLNVVYKQKAPA